MSLKTQKATMNNDDENDDDLYNDVDEVALKIPSSHESGKTKIRDKVSTSSYHEDRPRLLPDRPKSLTEELASLQAAMRKLEEENKNLKRNIGTLYRTAVNELARKDRQIQQLQEENFQLQQKR
jgi:predicted RNase H-like nuclease (RuvC/YqgF family)